MKNRFNRLTSKEWLPFQKSWFKYSNDEKLYRENLRFFCKAENTGEHVLYFGDQFELFSQIAKENTIDVSLIENFKLFMEISSVNKICLNLISLRIIWITLFE